MAHSLDPEAIAAAERFIPALRDADHEPQSPRNKGIDIEHVFEALEGDAMIGTLGRDGFVTNSCRGLDSKEPMCLFVGA